MCIVIPYGVLAVHGLSSITRLTTSCQLQIERVLNAGHSHQYMLPANVTSMAA